MRNIPISAVPNQQITLTIGSNRWSIRLKVAVSSMIADILLNDQTVIVGQRIAVGTPIIPYDYLSSDGNFILLVDGNDLPDWQKFGVSQQLVYVTPDELP